MSCETIKGDAEIKFYTKTSYSSVIVVALQRGRTVGERQSRRHSPSSKSSRKKVFPGL